MSVIIYIGKKCSTTLFIHQTFTEGGAIDTVFYDHHTEQLYSPVKAECLRIFRVIMLTCQDIKLVMN